MSRPRKPARLYYHEGKGQWIIRDGGTERRTGHGIGELAQAEAALQRYLADRKPVWRLGPAHLHEITVDEVLSRYVTDRGETMDLAALETSVKALVSYWGSLTCDMVTGNACRAYQKHRAEPRLVSRVSRTGKVTIRSVSAGSSTVRRELGVLQAALNHCHSEGVVHGQAFRLPKPAEGEIRDRWLTVAEAAALVSHAGPHVRRWILLSLSLGRRERTVLSLPWARIDLENAVIDTTPATIRRHYWHHSPYHQAVGVEAVNRRGRWENVSGRVSGREGTRDG